MNHVSIIARERGKIVARREGHNVFVENGHIWLARLVACTSFFPDTPERDDRICYMQFGIGGNMQSRSYLADAPPYSTSYQAGYDPNMTPGHSYNKMHPIYPFISTLERPVRISGGSDPYPGANPDVWLVQAPSLYTTHPSIYSTAIHAQVSGDAGDVAYGSFTEVPLSEVGLLTDGPGVGVHIAYSPIVAYYTFDTFILSPTVELEAIWTLKL